MKNAHAQATRPPTCAVPLRGLRPGTYACHLYVNGLLQASRRVVIE